MRKVILLLGLVLQVIIVDAQSVSGSLVDEKGNPVSFAAKSSLLNVLVEVTTLSSLLLLSSRCIVLSPLFKERIYHEK